MSTRRQATINSFFFFLVWHLNVHHILFKRQGSLGRPHSTTHVQNNTYYFSLAQLIQDFCRNKLSLGATATQRTFLWHDTSHCTLNSTRHMSVDINWKLIIEIFSIYANLKTHYYILIISLLDWPIISCSKGSGCKNRKWRFPTCRERSDDMWETPSSTRLLISVIEASPFSQEAWILGK